MFQTDRSLPALLDAKCYSGKAAHDRDCETLRDQVWQLVASTSMLPNDGDYLTIDRLGVPILLRNHEGSYHAYHNVCAHRGCRLAEAQGNSSQIKCPYHGWQYGVDGRTRKIPFAKNFPHFDREQHRLRVYPVRQIGQLLFVWVGDDSQKDAIDDWGPWEQEFGQRTCSQSWRPVIHTTIDYPTDWKIPVEGSLESYHLDEVHAQTFGTAPSEEATHHELFPTGTVFWTSERESSFLANLEVSAVRAITGRFDPTYRHVHVFPNVMASFTDSFSLVYQIHPMTLGEQGAHRSQMTVFGYSRRGERMGALGHYVAWWLGVAAKRLARKVLDEDAAIFPKVQAGIDASVGPRIFGRSEERLYAFHEHWSESTRAESTPD